MPINNEDIRMADKSQIKEGRIRLRYKNDGKEKDTRMTDKRKRQE